MAAALVKNTIYSAALFLTLHIISIAHAGSVEGPYVIWVNLSGERATTDAIVKNFLDSGDTTCWNDSAIMFMRSKPKNLTEQTVKQALIENNPSAQKKIQKILTTKFGDAENGFDGIIAYTDHPTRSMFSMTRSSKKIERDFEIKNTSQIPGALCNVMPDVKRAP